MRHDTLIRIDDAQTGPRNRSSHYAVIQFNKAVRYAGDGFATFQIVLERDGTILFYYKEMTGNVNSATVGIQNVDGDKGVTIANEQPYLKTNLAVRITQSTQWLQVS